MDYLSLFYKSNKKVEAFVLNYLNSLIEFYNIVEDEMVDMTKGKNVLMESTTLIKAFILYYHQRDSVIENISKNDAKEFGELYTLELLLVNFPDEKKHYYKQLNLIHPYLYNDLFFSSNYVSVCTKNSLPSMIWHNQQMKDNVFYTIT